MEICGTEVGPEVPCFPQTTDSSVPVVVDPEEEEPIEIDYDSAELTMLYQAIEDKAFMAAIDFLESGVPEVYDECRTWVTRYEKGLPKKIRWSQLPLHAAIVFGAPPRLIELLVEKYPKAVRCTDDRVMLPIHLAFSKCSGDATLHCLLKEFPESINAKDSRGRTPLSVQSSQKSVIIGMFEENAKSRARKALTNEKVGEVQKKLTIAYSLTADLQNKNETIEEENRELKEQLAKVKEAKVSAVVAPPKEPKKGIFKMFGKKKSKTTAAVVSVAKQEDDRSPTIDASEDDAQANPAEDNQLASAQPAIVGPTKQ